LALVGAVVANSTGAGGGVVFVPAFSLLGLTEESIIATSFAIQCFGMTAGTIAWRKHVVNQVACPNSHPVWQEYWNYVFIFGLPSLLGVVLGQYVFESFSVDEVRLLFKLFSIAFGLSILATTWFLIKNPSSDTQPILTSVCVKSVYAVIGLVGGIVTAFLSIGVGELVAVTLILMRVPVKMAVGVAVSVSAMSVWVGVQKYIWIAPTVSVQILIFAAPAAVIGGTLAKKLANAFSPIKLKLFIAIWILISALAM